MLTDFLNKLTARQDLTAEEASAAMEEVMTGRATSAQIAGLLMALAMKGERPAELVGFARTMRAHSVKLAKTFDTTFDTCGTGGDRSGTVNVSSAAAVVLAACGVRVAKHGNRSVSSQCGSADVFDALGVQTAAPPSAVERSLETVGIAFLFAPTFHPSMRHAGPTRRELGLRTAFNLLGPLTNPVGPCRQIVGVPRAEHTELLARALGLLGSERAWVVHGADGLDEISTTGYTKVSEARDGHVTTFHVHPADFGLKKAALSSLKGGDAPANAATIRRLLDGESGPVRDIVLLNAGAAMFVAGRAASIRDGIAQAADAIDRGDAARTLDRMAQASQSVTENA
jgi:anthranilate phosphoribosyltransferase